MDNYLFLTLIQASPTLYSLWAKNVPTSLSNTVMASKVNSSFYSFIVNADSLIECYKGYNGVTIN